MYFSVENLWSVLAILILFVGSIVICLNQKKRNKYILRLILCCLGNCIIAFFNASINYSLANPYLYFIVSSFADLFIMFGLTFASVLICYSIKVKTALIKVITAYLAYIAGFAISYLMVDIIFGENDIPAYYFVIPYIIEIATLTITILLFRQRLKVYEEKDYKIKVVILFATLFVIELVMSSYIEIEYVLGSSVLDHIMYTILNIFYCLSAIYVSYRNIDDEKQSLKDQLIANLLIQEAKQYQLEKENLKNIYIRNQNLNNKFYFLDGSVAKSTLNELENLSIIYNEKISTGNETLDLVLKQKSFYAQNNKIEFLALANGGCLSFIDNNDLYSLMNNLLNKAMDECLTLKDDDKKSISLNIRDTSLYESIHLEYYFNDMYLDNKGALVKKPSLVNDDLNQQAIDYLVKKYNGIITYSSDNDILIVDIVFCKNII